jgi:ribosomal protein S18 acetylase RimI-like enzyme
MILKKILTACKYHLKDKWEFIYLGIDITAPTFSLPNMDDSLSVRIADRNDIPKIESDIGIHLADDDRKQIQRIGEEGFSCFIGSRNEKIIHFFLVYESAINSLLAKTPFDKKKMYKTDAYLGSAFTVPDARGLWVVPVVLMKILEHLKGKKNINRALVLVHKETPGAAGFYQRLGFSIIQNPEQHNLFYFIAKGLNYFQKK